MSAVVLHGAARPPTPRTWRRHPALVLLAIMLLGAVAAFAITGDRAGLALRVLASALSVELPVREVKVEGELQHVDRARLRALVTPHLADGLLQVDLARLRVELQQLPWVESVSVRRLLPATVLVKVHEHQPVARWNHTQLLGRDGRVFDAGRAAAEFVSLPALAGPPDSQRELHRVYRRYAPRLAALGLRLQSVAMDARRSYRLALGGGVQIELGREQLDQRLQRFVTLYRGPLRRDWEQVHTIDLRYTNGLAVRWHAHGLPLRTGSGDA